MAKRKSKSKLIIDGRQISLVLLIAGAGLLIWGVQRYGAFGEELNRSFGGSASNETMMIIIGGAVLAILGAFRLLKK